ncbi:MAG: 3-phosphoshikimate 1-carboxyvinyltransferase [Christensenellaceae bacterium]|nr:3-phosphoshikimate 1-carboxyvinyltransferase [Christensenellaceae bacterium]
MDLTLQPTKLAGSVAVPPSKSAAHRAIISAALAEGTSRIAHVDLSSDIRATIGACRALGVKIQADGDALIVNGGRLALTGEPIDCAESGSTLRFFIPIACGLDGEKTFTGRGRLPQRPVDAYLHIFDTQGLRYTCPPGASLPLTISGVISPGEFHVDGRVSSQFVTGLLFALPLLEGDSRIIVTGGFESRGYVDLTADILRRFGIDITAEGDTFIIPGNQKYKPRDITVEGDYSQAAFFLVAGAISGGIRVEGLDAHSLQPDRVIVDILKRMGADISEEGGALVSRPARLHGEVIDVSQCPDLVPPLAIAAAFAEGQTHITGAARLRIKESDRLHALAQNLTALGIRAEELPDGLIIHGGQPTGGSVDSFGDHRIAMAFSVAAAGASDPVKICGADCVDKSYPAFYQDYVALGGEVI